MGWSTQRCAPSSVHHVHSSFIQLKQGRQDLNLQPAVFLETAALPVELRPLCLTATLLTFASSGSSLSPFPGGLPPHDSRAPRSVKPEPTDSALIWEKNPEVRVYNGTPGRC